MQIEIGWWAIPLAVSVVAFAKAAFICRPSSNPSVGDGIIAALLFGMAAIVSLIAWLIYALAT